jgi:hypothetical protein
MRSWFGTDVMLSFPAFSDESHLLPRTRLDDAGNCIFRPATGYAMRQAAPQPRRPHASDADAGFALIRVARMVRFSRRGSSDKASVMSRMYDERTNL